MNRPDTQTAQDRLITAAIDEIVAGKQISMPLRRVAERAQLTTGAIQHHFGNREGLWLAVLQRHGERVVERLQARQSSVAPRPPAVARSILLEFLPLDDERAIEAQVAVVFEGAAVNDVRLATAYREQYAMLANLLAEHLPGCETRDVDLVLAAAGGIRTDLLLGRLARSSAVDLVDHLLSRLPTRSAVS